MKITYNWLKDYIDVDLSPQELADELTNVGFEVEELTPLLQPFSGVVVGKVEAVSKHPDADKLSVCTVSDGNETFQVICGAANVAQGQLVPFAKVGARLPGDFKIKKAKIRGVESFGMICSKEELGLEKKSEGIWPFEQADPLGTDVYEMLNRTPDYIYDFFITPNRPDCLSLVGIAREVSAITDKPVRIPNIEVKEDSDSQINEYIKVHIHDTEGCPRYAARVIRNVTIAPSPEWMQQRLEAVGIRPINNIVDITNYVLMEMGQPLHAFDLQKIRGKEIHVRASKAGEKFTTLDDKERSLPDKTVMICDAERPVAIGGIMGGQNSEVSQTTTDILLESAYFTPTRIAFAGKKLGLSSEASQRFERGVDPNNVLNALNRAAALMSELAGGQIVQGIDDVYPEEIKPARVPFNPDKINRLLGTTFGREEIEEKLQRLQLKVKGDFVEAPTFRVDLKIGVDLAEEVARLVNLTNLPTNATTEINYEIPQPEIEQRINYVRSKMLELNLQEAFSASMLKQTEAVLFKNGELIKILNPISDDLTTMRPSLLPGLLRAANHNINRNMTDVRLFETGRIFTNYRENTLPDQPYSLAMILTGNRQPEDWSGKSVSVDFYDIKGYLENFVSKIALDNFTFILYDKSSYFMTTETVALTVNDTVMGLCGRIEPDVCTAFGIDQAVYAFELNLELLANHINYDRHYQAISRFPYSERDMALVLDEEIPAADILQEIRNHAGKLLQHLDVFDVFRGGSIPEGKKSIAIRLRFQSMDRTLSDKEVDKVFRNIIKRMEKTFNASLRN